MPIKYVLKNMYTKYVYACINTFNMDKIKATEVLIYTRMDK